VFAYASAALAALVSGFVPSAFFPVGAAALSGVTPPAATSEAVASGGSVTGWTFGAFTDPDGRIASYTATLVTVTGSGSLSGSGLGPYSITGTTDGDAYTVELDALDGDGGVLATAVHTIAIATSGAVTAGDYVAGGAVYFDGIDQRINLGRVTAMEPTTGGAFTVAARVKFAGGGNGVVFRNSSTTNTDNQLLFYGNTGSLNFSLKLGNQNYAKQKVGSFGGDQVVIMTCDGTDYRVWVNGAEITSWSAVIGSYPTATETWDATFQMWLGGSPAGIYLDGWLGGFAYWSSDQTANVAAIYDAFRSYEALTGLGTPPNVGYLPLSLYQQSHTATDGYLDLSGSANHGTGENLDPSSNLGSSVQPHYYTDGVLAWIPF
jgi:hypothetical protein